MRRYNRRLNSNRNSFDEARAFKADAQSIIQSIESNVEFINNSLEKFLDVTEMMYRYGFSDGTDERFYLYADYATQYLQALERLATATNAAVNSTDTVETIADDFLHEAGY